MKADVSSVSPSSVRMPLNGSSLCRRANAFFKIILSVNLFTKNEVDLHPFMKPLGMIIVLRCSCPRPSVVREFGASARFRVLPQLLKVVLFSLLSS